MENFLRSKEYWQVVSDGIAEPAAGTAVMDLQRTKLEGQRLKDLKAKNYLFQAIDRSIWETNLGNHSLQGHIQAHLGFHEEDVPRFRKG